jgi:hypothetical protein
VKYLIFAVSKNGSESTKFQFEYETEEKLSLESLITNPEVVTAALRNCPVAPSANSEVKGLSFERLRDFLVQPVDKKMK